MKRALILLTILGLAATPMMAVQLEAPTTKAVQKHAVVKHHAKAKQHKKHLKKKLARRTARKRKTAA